MALNFPTNPSAGQIFTAEGQTFIWNGTVWAVAVSAALWATDAEARAGIRRDVVMNPANVRAVSPYVTLFEEEIAAAIGLIPFLIPPEFKEVEFYTDRLVGTTSAANSEIGFQFGTGTLEAPTWITDYSITGHATAGARLGAVSVLSQVIQATPLTNAANAIFSSSRGTLFGFNRPGSIGRANVQIGGAIPTPAAQHIGLHARMNQGALAVPITLLRLVPRAGSIASGRYKLIGVR